MTKETLSPLQEQLIQRADAIFAKVSEAAAAAAAGADFAAAQLPDIAYQYIAFNRAYLTFIVLASVITLVAFQYFCIKWANKACLSNHYDYDKGLWTVDQGLPYIIGTCITGMVCITAIMSNLKAFFMVWFAPKIFLITNIISLVK